MILNTIWEWDEWEWQKLWGIVHMAKDGIWKFETKLWWFKSNEHDRNMMIFQQHLAVAVKDALVKMSRKLAGKSRIAKWTSI